MVIENFELELDGDWQSLPIEDPVIGLQIENPIGNATVQYRWSEDGVARNIVAGDTYDVISPKPNDEPISTSALEVKGTAAETIYGEQWLYNYQA